jgi:head-tail adaptor
MRGGTLDRSVAIQRATFTQSPSGEPQSAWVTISTRPAMLDSGMTGTERLATEQVVAKAQVAFTIRWATVVADITPLDRIIYPASVLANSPADPLHSKIYDIIMVQEIGRREQLRIFATVRQDENQ